MFKIFSFITLMVFILGCSKIYKLDSNDINWNPYLGGETLIFRSTQGELDTIFVKKIVRNKTVDDNLSLSPNYHESLDVIVEHTDPTILKEQRYLENSFFEIYRGGKQNTFISFHLKAKKAWFYSSESFLKSRLEDLASTNLVTKSFTYDDIIKIESGNKDYYDRDNFVTAIYWSKSKGYVRYDLKDNIFWELQ